MYRTGLLRDIESIVGALYTWALYKIGGKVWVWYHFRFGFGEALNFENEAAIGNDVYGGNHVKSYHAPFGGL